MSVSTRMRLRALPPSRDNANMTLLQGDSTRLDETTAARLGGIAASNVIREYPNHPGHALERAADVGTPRELHPAFYGSYDWHSCVHMHWLLARLRRVFPDPHRDTVVSVFNAHLSPRAIAGEVAYFRRAGARSFERTYGWGWLLVLAAELRLLVEARDGDAAAWENALAPLTALIVDRYLDYLPRARYPIRYGIHANSAFGLACALDYAATCGHAGLRDAARASARAWFESDVGLPAAWEPSGADFLSPALVEADLMRRVLAPADFAAWLARALPDLGNGAPAALFEPATVTDRGDAQIVHLDGLNLSRAWCFRGVARALPEGDPRIGGLLAAADRHVRAGLLGLASADYYGTHWLATFALRALTA
jgi:hypothetical protein